MTDVRYYLPKFRRLLPRTAWRGGMLADTDFVTLADAARFASKHAATEITADDFLRAAGREQIPLYAIVHYTANVQSFDGGIFCNAGQADENIVPAGSIPKLPLTACQHLAAAGCASWRTFDGFKNIEGELMRFTIGTLIDGEPAFETVPADCRMAGYDVHALADAFIVPAPEEPQDPPARARRDLLAPVIEAAQKECGHQFDAPAVWASLVRMADARKRPLLGVSDDGIKWQDSNDEPQFLNIKNLRDRLSRSKKKAR